VTSVEWYREDRPISKARSYLCSNKDVGWQIRAELKLSPSGIVVNVGAPRVIKQCAPSAEISFDTETVIEGDVIKPNVTYHGGVEGKSVIQWQRETATDKWDTIQTGLQYQTNIDDVDHRLRLVYTPVRNDGENGRTETLEIGPVESQLPRVKNVTVSQNSQGVLSVAGTYRGGTEGFSYMIWRVYEENAFEPRKLGKSVSRELVAAPDVIGKMVDCVYVPIRQDGCAGTPTVSGNRIRVQPLPTVVSAELLVKGGNLVVDATLHCRCTVSRGSTPHFQWFRGDGTVWEAIEQATQVEFTPTRLEVGYIVRCSVIAINAKGWKSAATRVATQAPVAARKAVLSIMFPGETPDAPFTVTPPKSLTTGVQLTTNLPRDRQKSADLQWQKEVKGQWTDVVRAPDYLVTADDVGAKIRVTGRGGRVSRPTNPVEYATSVIAHARAAVRASVFQFTAVGRLGGVIWTIAGNQHALTMKSNSGTLRTARWNMVQCECVPGTQNEFVLATDPSSTFSLIPDLANDRRLETRIGPNGMRDWVVATIRLFAELYINA
jgi:hypothetical protein